MVGVNVVLGSSTGVAQLGTVNIKSSLVQPLLSGDGGKGYPIIEDKDDLSAFS
jgi:hypothetical protein